MSFAGIAFELGATVILDHPIPPDMDYYFEVKILAEGDNRYVGIHFCPSVACALWVMIDRPFGAVSSVSA